MFASTIPQITRPQKITAAATWICCCRRTDDRSSSGTLPLKPYLRAWKPKIPTEVAMATPSEIEKNSPLPSCPF